MFKIQNCKYLNDYQLHIVFNNGISNAVNLKDEVAHEPYTALQNLDLFRQFYLDHGALCWLNGKIDMAVEYLFFLANKDKPELQTLFKKWGYIKTSE
jgi:hypothetical protein